jgi:hypothetical protein
LTVLYKMAGRLGIRTEFCDLWNGHLVTKHGMSHFSENELALVQAILLRSGRSYKELIQVLWPDPDDEPEWVYSVVARSCSYLNKVALKPIGLRFNNGKRNQHCGKWIEVWEGFVPRPIIDHQYPIDP